MEISIVVHMCVCVVAVEIPQIIRNLRWQQEHPPKKVKIETYSMCLERPFSSFSSHLSFATAELIGQESSYIVSCFLYNLFWAFQMVTLWATMRQSDFLLSVF